MTPPLAKCLCTQNTIIASQKEQKMPSSYAPGFYPAGGFSQPVDENDNGGTGVNSNATIQTCDALYMEHEKKVAEEYTLELKMADRAEKAALLPPTTFVFDITGMTERDLIYEFQANAHGYSCLFCNRFHCPQQY